MHRGELTFVRICPRWMQEKLEGLNSQKFPVVSLVYKEIKKRMVGILGHISEVRF